MAVKPTTILWICLAAFAFVFVFCAGFYGLLFYSSSQHFQEYQRQEAAVQEKFDRITSGMSDQDVDAILGMPDGIQNKPDGTLRKDWHPEYGQEIHVTFRDGKAIAKLRGATDEEKLRRATDAQEARAEKAREAAMRATAPAEAEMLKVAEKMGRNIDLPLARGAVKARERGVDWSLIDETMGQATLETQIAYRAWRAACLAQK